MSDITTIQSLIYEIRGQRVMLDFDLAMLYGVETRALNQAVKRNQNRFPEDFMFQLSREEWEAISSQFVMTSRAKRPKSALPLAFTEHGALMLSSVLRSDIAQIPELEKSIENLRLEVDEILADQNDINESTRAQLDAISTALAELQAKEPRKRERRQIGFITHDDNK